jgi:putative transposase
MNAARVTQEEYVQFLISTPKVASATEAARVQPVSATAPAHDAFTRLLARLEPDPTTLWQEVRPLLTRRADGLLVIDDTVLDKPYAKKMGLVRPHWSGKHQRVVRGINLVTLAWTDGDGVYPTDYRIVDKDAEPDETKNDHFRTMLAEAKTRGFQPRYVAFDAWYSSKENLKAVRKHGWHFLTQVRSNRRVNPDRTGNRSISDCAITATGTVVHLEGFGLIKAFRIVATNGDTEHWITNDLTMTDLTRLTYAERAWQIEEYHRGLKQSTEVERCPARLARSQKNHIGFALRAFVRFEAARYRTGLSWFEAKIDIARDAVRTYLAKPRFTLAGGGSA